MINFIDYTTTHTLTVTAVAQDTIDGVLEPQAQAIILTGEAMGPMTPQVSFTIPSGTTTGQVGFVFGYKSGADYWVWARDMNGTAKIYRVYNGVITGTQSVSYPAPVAGGTTNYAFIDGGWAFSGWAPLYNFGTAGFPEGKIGFFTTIANTVFSQFFSFDETPVHLCGRWINDSSFTVNTSVGGLQLSTGGPSGYDPILLENLRLQKFQATFALTRASGQSVSIMGFVFNAADRGNFDYVQLTHSATVNNPVAYTQAAASVPTVATGGSNPSNIPTCASGDTLWCRVQYDGTTLTAKAINSSTAPSEATWSSTTACYSNTSLTIVGGQFGYVCSGGIGYINNFTLKSYDTATSSFDITEHWDNFTTDGSGFASDTLTYDAAGNLTYDGQQQYTYDAWNRLISIAHAYRDSGGTLQHGQTFSTMAYDGLNRRISKTIANTGQWDCAYNYYYDGWRLIETRNGSAQTLKQHVWAPQGYIDELVQVCANSNPATGNTCSGWFWAMQDANYNVLGLINSSGAIVERYEYSPYGQRNVYFAAGNTWAGGTSSNDPGCYARAYYSPRYTSSAPYFGLCDIGHQGLVHDEEADLLENRFRSQITSQNKFAQRDILELATRDGDSLYQSLDSNPVGRKDPSGLAVALPCSQERMDELRRWYIRSMHAYYPGEGGLPYYANWDIDSVVGLSERAFFDECQHWLQKKGNTTEEIEYWRGFTQATKEQFDCWWCCMRGNLALAGISAVGVSALDWSVYPKEWFKIFFSPGGYSDYANLTGQDTTLRTILAALAYDKRDTIPLMTKVYQYINAGRGLAAQRAGASRAWAYGGRGLARGGIAAIALLSTYCSTKCLINYAKWF